MARDPRFKNCLDCGTELGPHNESMQPIRCYPCFQMFADKVTKFLEAGASGNTNSTPEAAGNG